MIDQLRTYIHDLFDRIYASSTELVYLDIYL